MRLFAIDTCGLTDPGGLEAKQNQETVLKTNKETGSTVVGEAGAGGDPGPPTCRAPRSLQHVVLNLEFLLEFFLAIHPGAASDQDGERARRYTIAGALESCLSVLKARLNATASGPMGKEPAAKQLATMIDQAMFTINQTVFFQAEKLANLHAGNPAAWLPTHGPPALHAVQTVIKIQQGFLLPRLQAWFPLDSGGGPPLPSASPLLPPAGGKGAAPK